MVIARAWALLSAICLKVSLFFAGVLSLASRIVKGRFGTYCLLFVPKCDSFLLVVLGFGPYCLLFVSKLSLFFSCSSKVGVLKSMNGDS